MTHAYLIADSAADDARLSTVLLRIPDLSERRLVKGLRGVSCTEEGEGPMVLVTGAASTFRRLIETRRVGPLYRVVRELELALNANVPTPRGEGDWHLPFIDGLALEQAAEHVFDVGPPEGYEFDHLLAAIERVVVQMSVVRCCEVAWSSHFSVAEHLNAYKRIMKEGRFDAAEHQATPDTRLDEGGWKHPHYHGSIPGWKQYRKMIIGENMPQLQAAE